VPAHRRPVTGDTFPMKCRLEKAALPEMHHGLARNQAFAEQALGPAESGFYISTLVGLQDFLYSFWIAENKQAVACCPQIRDITMPGNLFEECQAIAS